MQGKKATISPVIRDAFRACRGAFGAVAVFSLFINLLMLTVPLYMLQIFDRVLTSRSTETLVMLLLIAVLALMVMATLDGLRAFMLVRVGGWLDTRLGPSVLTESIIGQLRRGGDGSVQGLRDLSTVRTFLTGPGLFPIMDAPWTPIFIAVIFLLHPLVGWLSLGGAMVLFSLALANELATRNLLMLSGGATTRALSQAQAAVRNADVVEAMGMMSALIRRWARHNSEALSMQARASNRAGAITAASKFLRLCLQLGVLTLGAWLVLQNEMTPGGMIAGSILMARALAPVEQAIGTWKSLVAARDAYRRMAAGLALSDGAEPGMELPAPSGRIDIEGLVYAHSPGADAALRNISFRLQPGEAMGLIGPTAAGKTTLARLLVGNLVPRAGHARLDGMDVAQWHSGDLGRHIGYLPQDVELFGGTVRENIARMGEGDAEAVVVAARLAGVHEMVLGMEKGYDTEIGDGGAALSGGQRQRIALARAVYGDPKFIVLDEPSASLDRNGEVALLNTLAALKVRGVTVVVIAHRPGILKNVDKVLALRDGATLMFGPRDEVIAKLSQPAAEAQQRPAVSAPFEEA